MLKYPLDRVSGYVQLSDGQGNQYIPEWDLTRTNESRGSKEGDDLKCCGAFLALAKREALYQQMIDDGFSIEFKPRPDLIGAVQMCVEFMCSNGKTYLQTFCFDKDDCNNKSLDLSPYYDSFKMSRERREKQIKEAANG